MSYLSVVVLLAKLAKAQIQHMVLSLLLKPVATILKDIFRNKKVYDLKKKMNCTESLYILYNMYLEM